jgi:ATP-dependent RNA helicase DHX8/PRP22
MPGVNPEAAKIMTDTNGNHAGKPRRLASPELWELQQLVASGAVNASDYPELQQQSTEDAYEDTLALQEVDIELREDEPVFLKGQTSKTMHLSPFKVIKVPDGSLNRAAISAGQLAKERREIRISQQQAEQEKTETPAWSDPMRTMMTAGAASTTRKDTMPEWKRETMGKAPSFGKRTNLSIEDQRRTLPIYMLRKPLLDAVHQNQILVVIGDTVRFITFSFILRDLVKRRK